MTVIRDWKSLSLEDGGLIRCTIQTDDGLKIEVICDQVDRADDGSLIATLNGRIVRIFPVEQVLEMRAAETAV